MSAYFVFVRDKMKDPAAYAAYGQKAGASLASHPARPLAVNGALTSIEGQCPDGVVIIEFPSVEAAKAWYDSPAYQEAVGQRLAATEGRAVIVEGLPG
jgi:uncharacterized protein (DUF1330 family)